MSTRGDTLQRLDRSVVDLAKRVRVLGALSWSPEIVAQFLTGWRAGQPRLPRPPAVPAPDAGVLEGLREVERQVDASDPRGAFVRATAESYRLVGAMLQVAGTEAFHRLSREVYGGAGERLGGGDDTHATTADRLIASTADLTAATRDLEVDHCVTPQHVAAELQRRVDAFFGPGVVSVVVDPTLSAKAAASATRIRVRGATAFTPGEVDQLTEHEAFVHCATALNGRQQPGLACLSLGAPRTTATQEGIATFAELVSGAIDLARLRRIALRSHAVHLAEEGADFIEVFRYLLAAGQSDAESAHTAMRVFRGGDVRGRHVFTKDLVYLGGLVSVYMFLRAAIAGSRPELIERLFVGRLCVSDAFALEPCFDDGTITAPGHVPAWARSTRSLAAHLSVWGLLHQLDAPRADP